MSVICLKENLKTSEAFCVIRFLWSKFKYFGAEEIFIKIFLRPSPQIREYVHRMNLDVCCGTLKHVLAQSTLIFKVSI